MELDLEDSKEDFQIISYETKNKNTRIDICLCTGEETLMNLCANDSKFICPKCNSISKIENSYIDHSNFKIKADSKALRIFNSYWLPIIAAEDWSVEQNMSTADLEQLTDEINFKNYSTPLSRKKLNCNIIRSAIKNRKLSNSLNQHITKILLYYGVEIPYKPTTQETDIIFGWYLNVISEYEKIKNSISEIILSDKSRDNNITRTYYIYKIIDSIWKNNKNMRSLLSLIHLQHRKTIEINDLIWEKICSGINLQYYPTEKIL